MFGRCLEDDAAWDSHWELEAEDAFEERGQGEVDSWHKRDDRGRSLAIRLISDEKGNSRGKWNKWEGDHRRKKEERDLGTVVTNYYKLHFIRFN